MSGRVDCTSYYDRCVTAWGDYSRYVGMGCDFSSVFESEMFPWLFLDIPQIYELDSWSTCIKDGKLSAIATVTKLE